ncbi:ATP synthase subunit I [candidate division KSB1 bacterium]|nr:ATP synthase subunit I [candidate division KSB1 bacterium]
MLSYLFYFLMGSILGLFYFGALWVTIRRMAASSKPVFWVLGSFFFRLLLVLCAFILMTIMGGWQAILLALLGFMTMKFIATRELGPRRNLFHHTA